VRVGEAECHSCLPPEKADGWPAEEALHPDARRMEGEPGQDPSVLLKGSINPTQD